MAQTNKDPDISVVIPVFNEEQNFAELYTRLTDSLKRISPDYELLFVNDGSKDETIALIKQYADKIKLVHVCQEQTCMYCLI